MRVLEGKLKVNRLKGSEVMVVDDIPLVKLLSDLNGQEISLIIKSSFESSYKDKGIAELFYFEGSQEFYRGIKYVNDFFIDVYDMIEIFEKLEGKQIKLTITAL